MLQSDPSVALVLGSEGYAVVPRQGFEYDDVFRRAIGPFCDAWDRLEVDRYVPQGDAARQRRHAEFAFDPITCKLERQPAHPYLQSEENNQLYGGIAREFAPVEDATVESPCFRDIVLHDALLLAGGASAIVRVNVHMVRITATPAQAGEPSPEGMHHDGFDYIAIHLIRRSPHLDGARTTIAASDGRVLARTDMVGFLDSVFADDRRVFHGTSAARTNGQPGFRDVLLLSFDPA